MDKPITKTGTISAAEGHAMNERIYAERKADPEFFRKSPLEQKALRPDRFEKAPSENSITIEAKRRGQTVPEFLKSVKTKPWNGLYNA